MAKENAGSGGGVYDPGADIRLDYVFETLARSLKIKVDKWQKLLVTEEYRNVVLDFFQIPDKILLVVSLNAGGQIAATDTFPTTPANKCAYFIKKDTVALQNNREDMTVDDIKCMLIFGEVSQQPLENFICYIENVVRPIIAAEISQTKWPEAVVADVRHHSDEVLSILYMIQGLMKGKTLLPMPPCVDNIDAHYNKLEQEGPDAIDQKVKGKLEALASKWSQQIGEAVSQDSSMTLQSGGTSSGGHPTPIVELTFWEDRVQNLEYISEQLNAEKVPKIGKILEKTGSRHWPSFESMFSTVSQSLEEAKNIVESLAPFKEHLDALQNTPFDEVQKHLGPMMHCICTIWVNSQHYCHPGRIITLLRQVCNLLIEFGRAYLGGSGVLQMEPEEGWVKSNQVVNVLETFQTLYNTHKRKLPEYYSNDADVKHWDFLPHLVFKRFDKFMQRMKKLQAFFETSVEFFKLERIDIGGNKGKQLTGRVQQSYQSFLEFYHKFGTIQYDCTDPENDNFDKDEKLFKNKELDVDQRLSSIFCLALDDCHTPESMFKFILCLGHLLDRSVIKNSIEPMYPKYAKAILNEIQRVKEHFQRVISPFPVVERSMINPLLPPYTASIYWSREMRDRITDNMEQFKELALPIEKKEVESLKKSYDELIDILKDFEKSTFKEWKEVLEKGENEWLSRFIFTRNSKDGTLFVDFPNELYNVTKEVKHMEAAGFTDIPHFATKLCKEQTKIRRDLALLNEISSLYNNIATSTNPQEIELLQDKILEIDSRVDKGVNQLRWSDKSIFEYAESIKGPVVELESRLKKSQGNVVTIRKLCQTWASHPLYERKDGKRNQLLNLDEHAQARKQKQYKDLEEMSLKLGDVLALNSKLLLGEEEGKNGDSEDAWKRYLEYLDEIVLEGMLKTVAVSLGYLVDNTDTHLTSFPLLEVTMELVGSDIIFTPALDFEKEVSFFSQVEDIMNDMLRQGELIQRVKTDKDPNYFTDLENCPEIVDMKQDILDRVTSVVTQSLEFTQKFELYAYLWEDSKEEYLQQFLKYGHRLTNDEAEALNAGETVQEESPNLEQFKEVIDKFENMYLEVGNIPPEQIFDKWFRLDLRPFRQSLLNTCKEWSLTFKQYMIDSVIGGLSDLDHFISEANAGLSVPLKEGDLKTLISVMTWLQQVKERQSTTDNMFEPIKQYIELLKLYDYELPEAVYVQLDELPQKWVDLKRLGIRVKHQVAPLQAQEVSAIRKRIAEFDGKQILYKDKFIAAEIFNKMTEFPYRELDECRVDMDQLNMDYDDICSAAGLFEVHVPGPKALRQCEKELKLAKNIWDYSFVVAALFGEWKRSQWVGINVENMDLECKRMAKEVKGFDKDVKSWIIYLSLEGTIRDMTSSLKSAAELQNSAIRERHWEELMQGTKIWPRLYKLLITKFSIDETTTLADLLTLNLHNFEEEVKNVVDKAVKESSMEKMLKELDATWKTMEYQLESHPRTGIQLVKASEELIELLEENQVQLQNIAMSKFIGFFQEEVEYWQNRLFMADQVLQLLGEVQRTWTHLESIFIASEDIRKNLPEDSARFDVIDKDFKDMLHRLYTTKNVVEATNQTGILSKLEMLQKELSICEKALADYLETKRLAFPRFYFVSSVDLLDILSNGNEPASVAKHLPKLFDAMANLDFKEKTKIAFGMRAKDGECVTFNIECDCTGAVEQWLCQLEHTMRETIRHYFCEAVTTYEEKPREVWLQAIPAQLALCGTQVWWTTEVNLALGKLEEGYENALKDYHRKQVNQLNTLIRLLLGNLTAQERQKIMTICTIDVHSRDVVLKLISSRIEIAQAFQWQSQLRHRWEPSDGHGYSNICDAQFMYWYEYLGNTPRLVITPLTDRCYITLTQSLHLVMGGAPAGPAGTGKTETTKDLGRALGMMVYVFNCSEQMDYRSIGNIYKGLAQTGAWGCFDEFNRITVEVLSVVAVQVKSIQDAIRDRKPKFNFMGEEIRLNPTVGIFITMNPGYAGRSELPENLKALFRPCAMVVPDFELISEIMLVAEGFQNARVLARKFITLYTLCKELLSKQDHYDWGLRAIKSVLVVAGALKRGDPDRPEDQVLMRALRDFNTPKIVSDDVPVFMGLIGDLFPALDVPRKRDFEFESKIKEAALQLCLQAEDNYVLKVVQLQELIDVRHSVFIIGNAGTGKSQVWRTLFRTHQIMKHKPIYYDLNPKAVTNDELFGVINPATRDWKDGIFSVLMRDLANLTGDGPKWIILDGDIDPMWIESLNTVMDDNKVLTLASNERIAMTKTMRLLFEIYTLRTATPATVSRAGILYINPQDLGWNPYVQSWIEKRENSSEKAILTLLFDKYVPSVVEVSKTRFKKITPISDMNHIELLCHLLDCMITADTCPLDCPKEWFEIYFVFCTVWAFGSATFHDQLIDHRQDFSKWFQNEFRFVKFPTGGSVFDFYIDNETKGFLPWVELIPKFELDPDIPLQATLVPTAETTRVKYFLDMLIARGHPVMLVGGAGTGKSVIINEKLSSVADLYITQNVPFNFYTTSEMLQRVLEKPLEKKAGRNYGPPGNKKLIYFIDDMNMPMVDTYGTVQPHTLIRQHMDYKHWYDRTKLSLKDIHNVQYVSCMNPTAGSFTINPRLQRQFFVFSLGFPGHDAVQTIYKTILSQYLHSPVQKFPESVAKSVHHVVTAAIALHSKVASSFLPTAIKFHYIFNLRDLSNVFQGILFATQDCLQQPLDLFRLWIHEACRVYGDKLVDDKDIIAFQKIVSDNVKKSFDDIDETVVLAKPLIYCHFALGMGDPKYMPVNDFGALQYLLTEALRSYNEFNSIMNLVLFDEAVKHICKISRILESPRGNALLVGVGGSGKQSLSRLAAYMSGLDVFQVALKKGYGIQDLKADIALLYLKAGTKNLGSMLLLTDAQIAEEIFLVVINDMLASGEIPDLLPDDEVENVISSMRTEVKTFGLPDTRENCWKFFIDRVRRVLKCVLCFSPVGSTLRNRARKFPAVVNCTSIIWFQGWPEEALMSVSEKFVKEIQVLPNDLFQPIASFMAFVHTSVTEMSKTYLANEKRYNYTTPKSFLEQIGLYKKLVTTKNEEAFAKAERLESGLTKLESCAEQVEGLKRVLAEQEVVLREKNDKADKLIQVVGTETNNVTAEKENVAKEEKKVAVTAEEVTKIKDICATELEKAEPALQAAYAALNTLNKANLTELKTFTTPPTDVVNVISCVLILWEGTRTGKIPKDRSWKTAKTMMMGDVQKFLEGLQNLEKEKINAAMVDQMKPFIEAQGFDPELVRSKSFAASGLCSYVINVLKYNEVYQDVAPKRRALQEATDQMNKALDKLRFLKSKITEFEEKLARLTEEYNEAVAAKMKCQAEADRTALTIDLANRLVGGLAAEKSRWVQNAQRYRDSAITIPGDMLLVTAFVSYLGCFTKQYRVELLEKIWIPYLRKLEPPIPMSDSVDPLSILTDDAEIAEWNNWGLPSDRMSSENASILKNSQRWPLMIDPQLQGIKWIKNMHGKNLRSIRPGQKGYLESIEEAISKGDAVLLESIMENVDPVLEPLLARNLIKKGTAIKIGDREIDYNPNFQLILQTKLGNPHYKPEMQAQSTIINFTVTRSGLEDQLLAEVVKAERPDLEAQKSQLTQQQNEFKILLKKLEDDLLTRLQSAQGNFLDDTALVENLETTKRTAHEVEMKAEEAVVTSRKIDAARELYRPAAARASLLYFILNDLHKINPIYQFSLKAFSTVFQNAIRGAPHASEVGKRVQNLIDTITFSVWVYTTRGLFESDKLIFTTQMAIAIQLQENKIQSKDVDFLLRFPVMPNVTSPVEFLNNANWGAIKSLSLVDDYRNLDRDIENAAKRWKKIVEGEHPEREKLPQEWKNKEGVQRLCIIRALRPDRMTYAVSVFIEESLGLKFVKPRRMDLTKSFEETSNTTPLFFILSPGVDPLKDVESLGRKLGYKMDNGNFHSVSLGQGQEIVAENALDTAGDKGHWVILQNIHLVARWLPTLEKKLEQSWDTSHKKYRVFLSAEPASTAEAHIIPQGILESSIKITNEPPSGMLANMHKAFDNFSQDHLESCSKELEFKAILFSLCYFHAVVAERRKFGTQGWNKVYPFNTGDLTISVNVLHNYLEANQKVPWEDLRYLFGEIMYGGHITDDWDRRLCKTYLEEYMQQELLDGEILYAPGFAAPPSTDYQGYHRYMDESLPPESPVLYGLHPNAEFSVLAATSEKLFKTIFELMPRDSSGSSGQSMSKDEKTKQILDDIMDKCPDPFVMSEIMGRAEEKTPYVIVAFQECERMNILITEIRRSLKELDLGLKGELTITPDMEELANSLFLDQVPASWTKRAYPTTLGLGSWYADLVLRARELETWSIDFFLPPSVWLGGFFNPQSFLTAIMQMTARKQELPLDKMCLQCEVTKKMREEVTAPPKEGSNVHGLFLEGARWDINTGAIAESKLKELYPPMPVIFMKAITQDKADSRSVYECPVYKTRMRGPTYVWTFNLRSRDKPSKWVLGGVALLLQA